MYSYQYQLVWTPYGWVWQLVPVFVPVYAPAALYYGGSYQTVGVVYRYSR